jgi:hypothetical protein
VPKPLTPLLAFLRSNPDLTVVRHPNPKGLGPRRFVKVEKGEIVFARADPNPDPYQSAYGKEPGEVMSYLPADAPARMTNTGFTLLDGRIEYVIAGRTDGGPE